MENLQSPPGVPQPSAAAGHDADGLALIQAGLEILTADRLRLDTDGGRVAVLDQALTIANR
ncbi:MAG: hypothetical protein ACK5LS_07055, partial [Propioniciclava sp.]